MSLQVKAILAGILLAIILGLGYTAKYYHGQYVLVSEQLAAQKVSLDTAVLAGKDCSAGTAKFEKDAATKAAETLVAQQAASELAKKNEALAQQLLKAKPSSPNDSCVSAVKLFQDYKKTTSVGGASK